MSFGKSHYILKTRRIHVTLSEGMGNCVFRHHGAKRPFARDFFGREERALRPDTRGVGGSGHRLLFHDLRTPNIGKTSLLLKLAKVLGPPPAERCFPPVPALLFFSQILSTLALSQHSAGVSPAVAPVPRGRTAFGLRPRGDVRPPGLLRRHGCREVLRAHDGAPPIGDGLSGARERPLVPVSASGDLSIRLLFGRLPVYGKLQGVPRGPMLSILRPYVQVRQLSDVPLGLSPAVTRALSARGSSHLQMIEVGAIDRFLPPPVGAPVRAAPCRYPGGPSFPAPPSGSENPRLPANAGRGDLLPEREGPRRGHPGDLYAASVTEGKLNRYWREFFENTFPDPGGVGGRSGSSKRVRATGFPLDTVEGAISLMGASEEEGEASSPPSSSRGS